MSTYSVHHRTTYRYRKPVAFGKHRMMLLPREGHDQRLLSSTLVIDPEPVSLRSSDDALGNRVSVARFAGLASTLVFDSHIRVKQWRSHREGLNLEERAHFLPISFDADEMDDLRPYVSQRHPDPEGVLLRWAQSFLDADGPTQTLQLLTAMVHGIRRGLVYVRRHEKGIQSPAKTLALGSGTCRDFSELMIEGLRAMGLPARFVSGYLYVPSRDRLEVHGGGSTHAWLQVYLPGAGWFDICPTNAILGNEGLIRIAVAREPNEALPLSGSFKGSPSDDLGMEVTVKVVRETGQPAEIER